MRRFYGIMAIGALGLGLNLGGCAGVVKDVDEEAFYRSIGEASATVFPTFIRDGAAPRYSAAESAKITAFLAENDLFEAADADAEIPISVTPGSNQSKMFRESVGEFVEYLAEHPIDTDYAMLAEYLIGSSGKVLGVHLYVLAADGTPSYALGVNSHHAEFNEVNPQDAGDCTTIILNMLRADLVEDADKNAAKAAAKMLRPDSSVRVFPVWLAGAPASNVGDVLGLSLEKYERMSDVWPCEGTFERETGAEFGDVARAFGAYVAAHPTGTEYALYAEIEGERNPPKVLEVRAALADRRGRIVWTERLGESDLAFKLAGASNPMSCCILIAKRLGKQLDRSGDYAKLEGEGRMERHWRENSGTPDEGVREEMKARLAALREGHEAKTVAVYPAQLFKAIDEGAGAELAEAINESGLMKAVVAESKPAFMIEGNSNEQKRLWDLARALQKHVREVRPAADYALAAEYVLRPSDGKAMSVHFVLCDASGEWVIVDFQNDHQADFKRVDPHGTAGCRDLVLRRMSGYVKP